MSKQEQGPSAALLNEYRGNLFEYSVAASLSRCLQTEADFLVALDPSYRQRLQQYEQNLAPVEDLIFLQQMGQQAAIFLMKSLELEKGNQVFLVGKLKEGSEKSWQEADLLIQNATQKHPISLKLCRVGTQVFTKNAGIKSFLSRYFEAAETLQLELAETVNHAYLETLYEMQQQADFTLMPDFSTWKEQGGKELPGELPSSLKPFLKTFHSQVTKKLYESLKELWKNNPQSVQRSLQALCGFSHSEVQQLECFYQIDSDGLMSCEQLKLISAEVFQQNPGKLQPLKTGATSFDILFTEFVLKIRVKPSDKFTTSALKVVGSLKYF